MKRFFPILTVLLATAAMAQDLKQIERELKSRYEKKDLLVNLSVATGELAYDLNGQPVGTFAQTCARPELHVSKVKLTDTELLFYAKGPMRQVIAQRGDAPPTPSAQQRPVLLRIQSDGKPWDLDRIAAALDAISERRPLRLTKVDVPAVPEGATPPPPGSDGRILFFMSGEPVYGSRDGVRPPKAIATPDPEYSDEARKIKLVGAVGFRLVINEEGTVSTVRPASATLGHGLDESAMRAFANWRFQPATLDGKPVKTEVTVETRFCLY